MATDGLLPLTGGTWKKVTATTTETAVDLGTRAPIRKGLWARVRYYSASNASGANSATFNIADQSPDDSLYYVRSSSKPINLTTATKSGIVFISLVGLAAPPVGAANNIQLSVTIAGGGSTPIITYQADVVESQN